MAQMTAATGTQATGTQLTGKITQVIGPVVDIEFPGREAAAHLERGHREQPQHLG